jgi:tetratricopeptide (TPR) repeat protein
MHRAMATSRRAGRSVVAGVTAAAADSAAASTPTTPSRDAGATDIEPAESLPPLAPDLAAELARAEDMLVQVSSRLLEVRKPAARLGRKDELDIESAITRALAGEPEEAAGDLDQKARSAPKTDLAARAHYEIGEIRRRLGFYEQARESYEASQREKRGTAVSESAARKSAAISSRSNAMQGLKSAPDVLARWRAAQADSAARTDSLEAEIALTAEYETLASRQLQVAEIDLLELDQPLLALHEFERVLVDFGASLSAPRAAFGIAWIYDYRLRDAPRAQAAYERVVRDFPASPQGREAQAILTAWNSRREEELPSSRP